MKISIVIPTYKRQNSLIILLKSLSNQSVRADEIIIVSGEKDLNETNLKEEFNSLNLTFHYTHPSVCAQRNKGIKEAKGEYICLFDDDIETPRDYLQKLTEHLDQNNDSQIVTGLFMEFSNNSWSAEYPPKTVLSLLYKRIFNHALWGSPYNLKTNFLNKSIYKSLIKYYSTKGNGLTNAGWPLVTDLSKEVNPCQIYSLGASMCRSELIKNHPFDEILESSGIGDNYGLSLSIGITKPIMVLKDTYVHHHKVPQNRMAKTKSYRLRILAMDYFLSLNGRKSFSSYILLLWSLMGNLIAQILRLKPTMAWASLMVLLTLAFGMNPYKE